MLDVPMGLTINLDPATIKSLVADGYSLYAFRAVSGVQGGGGYPVIWSMIGTAKLLGSNPISWLDEYSVYISTTPIERGKIIEAGATARMNEGQRATIAEGGQFQITDNGSPGQFEILNSTRNDYAFGLSLPFMQARSSPLCALPLPGGNSATIAPSDQVLFEFSTAKAEPGTMVARFEDMGMSADLFGGGVLVDLSNATNCQISYDFDKGWDTGQRSSATLIAADADLVHLLLQG
jgi:hypothetical protein